MKKFTVDYDLLKPGQSYDPLLSCLRDLGARKLMYSKWMLTSNWSATQLRDYLQRHVDANDRIFVAELSGDWAGRNLLANPNDLAATTQGYGSLYR